MLTISINNGSLLKCSQFICPGTNIIHPNFLLILVTVAGFGMHNTDCNFVNNSEENCSTYDDNSTFLHTTSISLCYCFTVAILALIICNSTQFFRETMAPRKTALPFARYGGIYDDRHASTLPILYYMYYALTTSLNHTHLTLTTVITLHGLSVNHINYSLLLTTYTYLSCYQ